MTENIDYHLLPNSTLTSINNINTNNIYNLPTPSPPPTKTYELNDPPLPLTSSDSESDNPTHSNPNNTPHTPPPMSTEQISTDEILSNTLIDISNEDYIAPILHNTHVQSPHLPSNNTIQSISYSTTTTTTTTSKINKLPFSGHFDESLSEKHDNAMENIKLNEFLNEIEEKSEKSEKSTSSKTSIKHRNYRSNTSGDSNAYDQGKGYLIVTSSEWSKISKNVFCCFGLIMFGSDFKYFIGTNILIITPSILQWIYILPNYYKYVLDMNYFYYLCTYLCGLLLFFCVMYSLYTASFTDPGYLPAGNEVVPPSHQQLKPNGSKFCETCLIWRPPRAKHCRYCNCCVGTCVGQRNYKYFSLFLFSIGFYSAYSVLVCSVVLIGKYKRVDNESSSSNSDGNLFGSVVWKTIKNEPYAFGVALFSLFICLSVSTLAFYHCSLICQHQTTNENVKNTFQVMENPYDKGCINNCKSVYCVKLPKSQIIP